MEGHRFQSQRSFTLPSTHHTLRLIGHYPAQQSSENGLSMIGVPLA
jgi:hypothetical protein